MSFSQDLILTWKLYFQPEQDYVINYHYYNAERHTEFCPFFACDTEFICGDNIGNVPWYQHASCDQKTHESSIDL